MNLLLRAPRGSILSRFNSSRRNVHQSADVTDGNNVRRFASRPFLGARLDRAVSLPVLTARPANLDCYAGIFSLVSKSQDLPLSEQRWPPTSSVSLPTPDGGGYQLPEHRGPSAGRHWLIRLPGQAALTDDSSEKAAWLTAAGL